MKRGNGWDHLRRVAYTILIAFAIIAFWRGVWGLLDLYLLPSRLNISYSLSILIGIVILYLTKNLMKNLV
jgi:hypothetical protein